MTSAELKHHAKLQEWSARIQDCRSSGLSVRAWCKQEGVNATTYYRWERELLEQLKLSKKKLLGRFSEQVRLSRSWTG